MCHAKWIMHIESMVYDDVYEDSDWADKMCTYAECISSHAGWVNNSSCKLITHPHKVYESS